MQSSIENERQRLANIVFHLNWLWQEEYKYGGGRKFLSTIESCLLSSSSSAAMSVSYSSIKTSFSSKVNSLNSHKQIHFGEFEAHAESLLKSLKHLPQFPQASEKKSDPSEISGFLSGVLEGEREFSDSSEFSLNTRPETREGEVIYSGGRFKGASNSI